MHDENKLAIEGPFSDEDLENKLSTKVGVYKQIYFIEKHPGFEEIEFPNGELGKIAYNKPYTINKLDLKIELEHIALYEPKLISSESRVRKEARENIKFHYKRAISLISPKFANGWNRWSEEILDMFISDKLHKVLWGSGNCGKSAVMALLLYTKWRVRPDQRMIVIAAKVVKDASARVWGYIKDIHLHAPISEEIEISLVDNNKEKAIYALIEDKKTGKMIHNDRACIISLPVKVQAKTAEVGGNLIGKHPDDWLGLAFDECQEMPGNMLDMKVFMNFYSNKNMDVYAWGNPTPIDYYMKDSHDLLFRLGVPNESLTILKKMERQAKETFIRKSQSTYLLHFSMMDSPKDDKEESYNFVEKNGQKVQRLHFLGGMDTVERIAEKSSPNSPGWYSQVLGFPFIDSSGSRNHTVITPFIYKTANKYPLLWKTEEKDLQYFMGVDPSVSGHNDDCAIVIGKVGIMMDGRYGIDLMNGEHCERIKSTDDRDFIDVSVEAMYAKSQELKIPLQNIAIETHGAGDVLRYALQKHIEDDGKWEDDYANGQNYFIVSPVIAATDRSLFKSLGKLQPAKEMVTDIVTEYWVAVRCAIMSRQMFNVPNYILDQFYNRMLDTTGSRAKYKIENKKALQSRGIKSPNDADALCNMLEIVRRKGFNYRFYNKHGYTEYYGQDYDDKKNQKTSKARLGAVSRMLQLQNSFSQDTKPPKGWGDIDLV